MRRCNSLRPQISRRTILAGSLAGAAMAAVMPVARTRALAGTPMPVASEPSSAIHTWILTSPDEFRPGAPANPNPDDLAELVQLQATRDDANVALIKQWNSRPAVLPWTELANAALSEFALPAIRQYRANGLLQTAMADAVVAAFDAQQAYEIPLPATLDATIEPFAGIAPGDFAYPSAEAAVAGAAAAVLTALLPDAAAGRFTDLARSVAETRLMAGLNTRPDIEAGFALGQAIGEQAIALAADDAPQSAWDGSGGLEGDGHWQPTPPGFSDPQEPLAATWHRWILEAPDQFRPAPPPVYGSPAWASQVTAVQAAVDRRTLIQAERARYWQGSPASSLWDHFASELITQYGLDLPQAARVLAYTAVAVADAEVACWDGKYHYWVERPITADPELNLLFPTPPFPSYPSAHSTVSSAAAVVLAEFFPDDMGDLLDLSEEAAASRTWAGIHFPMDNDAGIVLGRQVGYLIAAVARHDGFPAAKAR